MKIFLIRHAESEQNIGLAPNTADSFVNITENRKIQAESCAEFLNNYIKDNNIDINKSIMIVSPYERTKQTANIINERLKIKNVMFDYYLIERRFGLFDNFNIKERDKFIKKHKLYKKYFTQTGKFYSIYPFGESVYDVVLRMKNFINFTLKNLDKEIENVFIISHGYAICAFYLAYFNYMPEWLEEKISYKMPNCCVKLIEDNLDFDYIYGERLKK